MAKLSLCIFATGFAITGLTGLLITLYAWQSRETNIQKYGLVFDAGSSHTKLFIYAWDGDKTNGTAVVKEIANFENHSTPGISHFSHCPLEAAESLEPYLEFAKENIPSAKIKETPVYLGATAGMRMLSKSNQDASNAILKSIRKLFTLSGFKISNPSYQVRILSGGEEGAYSWTTVNYLKGNFGLEGQSTLAYALERSATIGALDLGGASTQITFVPVSNHSIPEYFSFGLSLYGNRVKVYTHSFLCYGVVEAIRKYHTLLVKENNGKSTNISSPCWLKGSVRKETTDNIFKKPCTFDNKYSKVHENYNFIGTANHTECQRMINKVFNFTNCPYEEGCSFNQVYQPSVKNKSFMAFSIYYFVMEALNLTESSDSFSLETFDNAMYSWCNRTWQEARLTPGSKEEILEMLCAEIVYMKTLLTKGYGFDKTSWNSLKFNMTVKGYEVGWTMGYMIYTSNFLPTEIGQHISISTFSLLVTLFTIFIVLATLSAIWAVDQAKNRHGFFA